MRCCDQGAHIREWLTANRFDLTLQGGPNQHGTHKPRRTTHTNHSPPRLELQDRPTIIWSAELNMRPPKVNTCIPISPWLLDYSRRWEGVMYFRSNAVLGLPVSTTSYSRHAVSTIQTRSTGLDNGRSLTNTDRAKHSPSGLQFLSFPTYSNIPYIQNIETSYMLRVTGNYSTLKYSISRE